jgi:hypothetical protein
MRLLRSGIEPFGANIANDALGWDGEEVEAADKETANKCIAISFLGGEPVSSTFGGSASRCSITPVFEQGLGEV